MKKINLPDAPEFFRGACKPFVRMNQQLLDFYSVTENWKIRAACTSGMAIVFETDSEFFPENINTTMTTSSIPKIRKSPVYINSFICKTTIFAFLFMVISFLFYNCY